MSLHQTINKLKTFPFNQLTEWWKQETVPDWAGSTCLFPNALAGAFRKRGRPGICFLKTQAVSPDDRKRILALSALASSSCKDKEIVVLHVNAFKQSDPNNINRETGYKTLALEGLIKMGVYPLKTEDVTPFLDHSNGWLAAAAMAYLSCSIPSDTTKILRQALADPNLYVRARACTEIGFRQIQALRDEVELLIKDPNWYVSNSAKIAVEVLEVTKNT